MQETITGKPNAKAGDALLAQDTRYITPRGGEVVYKGRRRGAPQGTTYLAYPSAAVPRFLVPSRDKAAQRFVLRLMSAESPALGWYVRALLYLPGGRALLCAAVFRDCVVLKP